MPSSSLDFGRRVEDAFITRFLTVFLLVLATAPGEAQAQLADQLTASGVDCAGDYGNIANCKAGEIDLASVSNVEFQGKPNTGGTCYIGEPLTATIAEVKYAINTRARYNLLLWLGGEQGTDPAEGAPINGTGRCTVASLPAPFDSNPSSDPLNPFLDLDQNNADVCADIESFSGEVTRSFTDLEFECQDNDTDGFADLNILLTWEENSAGNCGTGPPEDPTFVIGAPSKCDQQLLNSALEIIEPATLRVVKNTIGDDDSFNMSWSSASNTATVFSLDTSLGPGTASRDYLITSGFGESDFTVAEVITQAQLDAGWTFVSAQCVDQGGASIGTFTDAGTINYRAIEGMTIDEGDAVTCTFTNAAPASLTLEKRSLGGTAVFPYISDIPGFGAAAPTSPGKWILNLDTSPAPAGTAQFTKADIPITDPINGDNYEISEVIPPSWVLQSVVCDDGQASNTETLSLNIEPGDDITCTYTNTLNASVTITKATRGGDGSFNFTTDALAAVPSGGFNITTKSNSGTAVFLGTLPAGTYTVTELVPSGWDLVGLSCTESGTQNSSTDLDNATATLRLEDGESITCTYVDRERGTIRIAKSRNPAGSESFGFTTMSSTSTPLNSAFNLNAGFETDFTNLLPGNYTVTENDPAPDFDLTALECDDSDSMGSDSTGDTGTRTATINLDPGELVTCDFTNTELGSLTIRKVITATGPTNTVFDFSSDELGQTALQPTAAGLAGADEIVYNGLAPGTYGFVEADPTADGWALINATCDDGSSPAAVSLAAGEDVVCTFLNAPLGSATIVKNSLGGDGGFQFRWGTDANGSIPSGANEFFGLTTSSGTAFEDFSFSLLVENPYDLTEVSVPGPVGPYAQTWNLTDIGCLEDVTNDSTFDPGDNGADATLVAQSGETVACSFLNVLDGTLVIRKESIPEALADTFTFTGDVAGGIRDYSTTGDELFLTVAPTTILNSEETVPAGYRLTNISCVGGTNSTVTIGSDANFPGFEDGDTSVSASIAAGETVVCTFTNEKEGSIRIVKSTQGGDGQFGFAFNSSAFQIDTATDPDADFPDLLSGSYLVAETVPTGWSLTDISCSGATNSVITIGGTGDFDPGDTGVTIDLQDGEDIVCTFNNILQGSITVAKQTLPDGSTQPFGFTGDASGVITDGGTITVNNLLPGTYTSTESSLNGWNLTDISCDDADSSGDPATRTATFSLSAGENVTCTFTNTVQPGRIIVDKITDPADAAQSFGFNLTGTGVNQAFSLTDAATPHDSGDLLPSGENGTYRISETPVAGWDLLTATCDNGSPVDAINVAPGETVTCTFQNAIEASRIVVDKVTDPAASAQVFDFTLSGSTGDVNFQLTGGSVPFNSGNLTPSSEAGTYSVVESLPAGWDLSSASCDNGDSPDSITIDPNQTVTCTFTNTIQRGVIIVDKVTDPTGSTQPFDFLLAGSNVGQAFVLTDTSAPFNSGGLLPTVENGTYTVVEGVVPGWDATSAVCSDGSPPSAIDLAPGEVVTCVFTNTIQRGEILVDKATDPAGSTQAFDFTLTGTGINQAFSLTDASPAHSSGSVLPSLENGPYSIAEAAVPGWDLTSAICSNGNPASAVTVAPGETVTCTFINTVQRGRIFVDKVTDPSGSTQSFDFTLTGTDVNQAFTLTDGDAAYDSGELLPTSENGTYNVTEAALQGWDQTSAVCSDGSPPAAVEIDPGETVTCTFTNTVQPGRIVVDKVTDPTGSTQSFDFALTGMNVALGFALTDDATPYDSGDLLPSSENGTYSLVETPVQGWDQVSATCDNGSPVDAVEVEPGETVTCTFQNAIQVSRIIVDKVTDPSGSTQSFDFTLTGTDVNQAFTLTDGDAAYDSGELLPTSENGTYNVTEAALQGWDQTSAVCSDGSPPAAVEIDPGETVTCTFTNTVQPGRIVVDKVTDPTGSTQSFDFALTGMNVALGFALTDDATPYDSGDLLPSSENGTYSLVETPVQGWDQVSATCDNGSPVDAVEVEPGETVTCTFQNAIQVSRIIVDKVTDPSGSTQTFEFTLTGDGDTVAFQLSDTDVPFNSGELTPSSEAGPYSVTELAVQGWDLTTATCDNGDAPDSISVSANDTVTCTFTNTLQGGRILVVQTTDPMGAVQLFDFTLTGTGVDQAFQLADGDAPYDSGDLLPSGQNGVYNLLQATVDGWPLSAVACDDGSPVDAIDLAPGETITCTFLNMMGEPVEVPVNNQWALLILMLSMLSVGWYYRPRMD